MTENIHPIFDKTLTTNDKERLINQKGIVVWMIGLSGSGKSTLAGGLENMLYNNGYYTKLLDGDNLRVGLNNNLGFTTKEREENIRRAAEAAKLFASNGTVTICSFISPTQKIRTMAANILGSKYCEVYVNCPLEICEQRDVKGLYAKARAGEIENFTGISAPFEAPQSPDIEINTHLMSLQESLDQLYAELINKIKI